MDRENQTSNPDIDDGLGNYFGYIGCKGEHINRQIRPPLGTIERFPSITGNCSPETAYKQLLIAIDRANAYGKRLCDQRKKWNPCIQSSLNARGNELQRCDSVSVSLVCDKTMTEMLSEGNFVDGKINRQVAGLPDRELAAKCGKTVTVDCK